MMHSLDEQTADDDGLVADPPSSVLAAAARAKAEAQKAADDRRAHRRVPGESLDWLNVARVKYGPEVRIIDLSRGGVLLQSERPLAPGSKQALELVGPEKSIVIPFAVLRSRIAALEPQGPIYRAACAFHRPLELPELAAAAAAPTTATLVHLGGIDDGVAVAAPTVAPNANPTAQG